MDFEEPFMVLSFITLSVIPRLRLTLDGLLDVEAQRLVPVVERHRPPVEWTSRESVPAGVSRPQTPISLAA